MKLLTILFAAVVCAFTINAAEKLQPGEKFDFLSVDVIYEAMDSAQRASIDTRMTKEKKEDYLRQCMYFTELSQYMELVDSVVVLTISRDEAEKAGMPPGYYDLVYERISSACNPRQLSNGRWAPGISREELEEMKERLRNHKIRLKKMMNSGAIAASGEIQAQWRTPGYGSTSLETLAEDAQLVCSFETGSIDAHHTVELNVRARKADGKFTKWRSVVYNPESDWDNAEPGIVTEAIDRNILRAVDGHQVYSSRSRGTARDGQLPEKTVAVALPSFADVAETLTGYEVKIKYVNDCSTGTGKCAWQIR